MPDPSPTPWHVGYQHGQVYITDKNGREVALDSEEDWDRMIAAVNFAESAMRIDGASFKKMHDLIGDYEKAVNDV